MFDTTAWMHCGASSTAHMGCTTGMYGHRHRLWQYGEPGWHWQFNCNCRLLSIKCLQRTTHIMLVRILNHGTAEGQSGWSVPPGASTVLGPRDHTGNELTLECTPRFLRTHSHYDQLSMMLSCTLLNLNDTHQVHCQLAIWRPDLGALR